MGAEAEEAVSLTWEETEPTMHDGAGYARKWVADLGEVAGSEHNVALVVLQGAHINDSFDWALVLVGAGGLCESCDTQIITGNADRLEVARSNAEAAAFAFGHTLAEMTMGRKR